MNAIVVGPTPRKRPELLYFPSQPPTIAFVRFCDLIVRDATLAMDVPALSGRMPIVCMLCGDHFKSTPCWPDEDGKTSHGLCDRCEPTHQEMIEDFFRAGVARKDVVEKPVPESSTSGPAEFWAARVCRENHEPVPPVSPARVDQKTEGIP